MDRLWVVTAFIAAVGSLAVLPAAEARNAAVRVVVLDSAQFDVVWRASRSLRASIEVTGSSDPGELTIRVQPSGSNRAWTKTVQVAGGTFSERIGLPTTLLPGQFVVSAGDGMTEDELDVTLDAPPEGVVARAWISLRPEGRAIHRLRNNWSRGRVGTWFVANFRWAARPATNQVRLSWYSPRSGLIGVVSKRYRPVTWSSFGGRPTELVVCLSPGAWRCVLTVDGKKVEEARVTVYVPRGGC